MLRVAVTAVVLLVGAAAAVPAGATRAPATEGVRAPAAAADARAPVAGVRDVFTRRPGRTELRLLDPVTLAPAGRAVRLHGFLRGAVRSPGGGRLALGVSDRGRVQIVDARAARSLRLIRTGRRTAWWLLAWPRARRLLAVGYDSGRSSPLVVVDPVRGRVVRSVRVAGFITAAAPAADGLAFLVSPPDRIGDATLVLVDRDGRQRRIALPGITAGLVPPASPDGIAQTRTPGLASAGGRVFVASATEPRIVEVDLASGVAVDHPLGTAVAAKGSRGSERQLALIGPGRLALTGSDYDDTATAARQRPAGLRIVDTRAWHDRLEDPTASRFDVVPGGGLALWNAGAPGRTGVTLLDRAGRRTATLLRGRSLVRLQLAGGRVYATATRPRHRTWVVDLRSRRVVARLATAQPDILLP